MQEDSSLKKNASKKQNTCESSTGRTPSLNTNAHHLIETGTVANPEPSSEAQHQSDASETGTTVSEVGDVIETSFEASAEAAPDMVSGVFAVDEAVDDSSTEAAPAVDADAMTDIAPDSFDLVEGSLLTYLESRKLYKLKKRKQGMQKAIKAYDGLKKSFSLDSKTSKKQLGAISQLGITF